MSNLLKLVKINQTLGRDISYFFIIKFSNKKYYYINMEIRENDYTCIIAPLSSKLASRETQRIFKEFNNDKRRIALDLSFVTECSYDFVEKLKEFSKDRVVSIFNIPSDLFVLFNIMQIDKSAKLYVSELDFLSASRQIINRKFSVV